MITTTFDQEFDTPNGVCDVVFRLLQLLQAQGCTIPKWSDGTVYDANPSTGPAAAADLDHTKAWVVVQYPDGRQHCWQRVDTNLKWRVKWSEASTFAIGSPGATRVPSAADERVLWGSGTDASPTGVALSNTAAHSFAGYLVVVLDDASGISWYALGLVNSNRNTSALGMMLDHLDPSVMDASDGAPYGHYFASGGTAVFKGELSVGNQSNGSTWGHAKSGGGGSVWDAIVYPNLTSSSVFGTYAPFGTAVNGYSAGVADFTPMYAWIHDTGDDSKYYKGRSKNMRWVTSNTSPVYGKKVTINTAGDYVVWGNVIVPWNDFSITGTNAPSGYLLGADRMGLSDTTPPVITVASTPTLKTDPYVVHVYDSSPGLRSVLLWIRLGNERGGKRVIYDGSDFLPNWSLRSTRTGAGTSGNPYVFTVYMDGGWPQGVTHTWTTYAVDQAGNV